MATGLPTSKLAMERSIRLSMSRGTAEWHRRDYEDLCHRLKELSDLACIQSLLSWDEQVMMPPGAAAARLTQRSTLQGVIHDKWTDPTLRDLLTRLEPLIEEEEGADEELNGEGSPPVIAYERAVVRDAIEKLRRNSAVPKALAQEMSSLESEGFQAWVRATAANDFEEIRPVLERWVALIQEKCHHIDPNVPPYDVCLHSYERGMTTQRVDEVFTLVKQGLLPLLDKIRRQGKERDISWIKGSYDPDTQAKLCARICTDLGFVFDQGRLDTSGHPFTSETHPTDVRITTRFTENCLMEGMLGAIHETGHALYEQGRNMEYDGLPVSEPLSLGVHESQSLLWERNVGLSLPFCQYILPLIREFFPQLPPDATPEDLYRAMNVVRLSSSRKDADEVTYPMHVILRYELERDLINGKIAVEDLPRLWDQKSIEYLGHKPLDPAHGILQDVHWAEGGFGYFPTYSLGAMYATQLYACACQRLPGLEESITKGQFSELREWLNREVHQVGSLHDSGDKLMQVITGSPLKPQVFLEYLYKKYGSLYDLKDEDDEQPTATLQGNEHQQV